MPSKLFLLKALERERQLVKELRARLAILEAENENIRIPNAAWEADVVTEVEEKEVLLLSKMKKLQNLAETQLFNKHPMPMLPPMQEASGSPRMRWRLAKNPDDFMVAGKHYGSLVSSQGDGYIPPSIDGNSPSAAMNPKFFAFEWPDADEAFVSGRRFENDLTIAEDTAITSSCLGAR